MRFRICALCSIVAALLASPAWTGEPKPGAFDRGDNALWMRRHWLHEGPTHDEIAALVESLRERGIRRIYPFLGPMDAEGWPGWRSKAGHVRYVPERAAAFIAEIHRIAPEIRVIPWTGGNLDSDVHLNDPAQRKAFAEQARRLVALGADGVQLNVEPLPTGSADYLTLLREVKAAIGNRTLSVAAYPPPTDEQPGSDVRWELPFMRKVCRHANELAVMAYDTSIASVPEYKAVLSAWTRQLAATLPAPSAGGCEWLMGVSAYDDDKDYHRPDVETVEHSLNGIVAGLSGIRPPVNFRGVAIYASFTADERKWAAYSRIWRGAEPPASPPPDPRNTTE
ncbi:MAG: hypothetical protein ACLPPF_11670 [Rhodomicrobium sp.]